MKEKFLNLPLIRKMAVLLVVFLLIPVLFVSIGTVIFMVSTMLREDYRETYTRMERSIEYLNQFQEEMEQTTVQCFTDMVLQRIGSGKGTEKDYVTERTNMNHILDKDAALANISLIQEGQVFLQSGIYVEKKIPEEYRILEEYFDANPQEYCLWQFPSVLHIAASLERFYGETYRQQNFMTFYSIINNYLSKDFSDRLGILAITVDGNIFYKQYRDYLPDTIENAFLITEDGKIFSHADETKVGTSYEWTDLIDIREKEGRFVKNGMEILWNYSENLDMILICEYPVSLTWKKQMPMVYMMSAIIALLAVFFCIYGYMEKRIITQPINEMAVYFKKMENGTFEKMKSPGRKDEVGQLQLAYNSMIDRVQKLTSKVLAVELEKKEAEFQALSAYINPHFLYNTLDSIHWKAILNRDTDVAEQILALSDVYRYILSRGTETVTFREEYEFEKKYFYLMKMRFDDRISYELQFAPEVYDIALPKLLMQPLIENAIVHGLEPTVEGGTVTVQVTLKGGELSITVSDDGVGFDRSVDLSCNEIEEVVHSFALTNINRRLSLYFEEYLFRIISEPQKGCKVMICIPEVKKYAFDDCR